MSALRRAQWPVKYEAIRSAFVRDGVNPATGRKCKLHKCSVCGELFPAKDMRADHSDRDDGVNVICSHVLGRE